MRILYLTDEPRVPLVTGNRLRNWNIVRRLSRRHEVSWWVLQGPEGPEPGGAPEGVRGLDVRLPAGWEESSGRLRKWLSVPFSREPRLMLRPPHPPTARKILEAARDHDIVHCSGLATWRTVPAPLAPRTVVDLQDSICLRYEAFLRNTPDIWRRDRSFLWYKFLGQGRKLRNYERSMPRLAGAAVMVARRDVEHLGAPGMQVIPNGVDCAYYKYDGMRREPGRILFFGNLRYRPNAEAAEILARRILPLVRARVPGAHVRLVGVNPSAEVQALRALPGVEVIGWVDDMRTELAAAQVFACPLQVASGLQNKVLEALAMELPTVASPISVDGLELERDRHVLVEPVGEGFAARLAELLGDEALRASLARDGRERVSSAYSWDRAAESFEALYAGVLAATPGRAA